MSNPEEEIRKLKEGIAKVMFCKENCNTLQGKCTNQTCNPIFRQERKQNGWPFVLADSLLRTVLSDLKIDTGELTEEEIRKIPHYSIPQRDKDIAKASRAKFVSIGEVMK